MIKTQCTEEGGKTQSLTKTVFGSLLVASLSIGGAVNASIVQNGGFESAIPNLAFQEANVANGSLAAPKLSLPSGALAEPTT